MTLQVVFRHAAKDEFENAAIWHEERQTGLGGQFTSEVKNAVERASTDPEKFPVKYGAIRSVPVRRFPYSVFYIHEPLRIVVLAVFHTRRNPSIWQSRA
jgi:toxin ParE1/3/4